MYGKQVTVLLVAVLATVSATSVEEKRYTVLPGQPGYHAPFNSPALKEEGGEEGGTAAAAPFSDLPPTVHIYRRSEPLELSVTSSKYDQRRSMPLELDPTIYDGMPTSEKEKYSKRQVVHPNSPYFHEPVPTFDEPQGAQNDNRLRLSYKTSKRQVVHPYSPVTHEPIPVYHEQPRVDGMVLSDKSAAKGKRSMPLEMDPTLYDSLPAQEKEKYSKRQVIHPGSPPSPYHPIPHLPDGLKVSYKSTAKRFVEIGPDGEILTPKPVGGGKVTPMVGRYVLEGPYGPSYPKMKGPSHILPMKRAEEMPVERLPDSHFTANVHPLT